MGDPRREDIETARLALVAYLDLCRDTMTGVHEGVLWVVGLNRRSMREARRKVGPRWYGWPVRVESMGGWMAMQREVPRG